MATLLAYAETKDGRVKRSSLEVVSRCRVIADARRDEVVAVVLSGDSGSDAEPHGGVLARAGASRIIVIRHEHLAAAAPLGRVVLEALSAASKAVSPSVVVLPSSEMVRQVLGALAVRLGAPALPDVSSFEVKDDAVEALRPVLASKFTARVRAAGAPVLVSVRSGVYPASEAYDDTPSFEEIDLKLDVGSLGQALRDVQTSSGGVDLSEARVVVAAGRGVRDEEGRRLVQELADQLGAAIGSSRAVVESGLFEASTQVGQTGKVVSPDLYIAVGISGAIQHVAGITNSRVIVAINKDPDAPIFRYATYGIVGDLYDVVPRLIEALSAR